MASATVTTGGRPRAARAFSTGARTTRLLALGAVGLVVLVLAAFATGGVLSYRAQGAEVAGVLADTTFALLALSGMPTAVCLGAYALLVFRHGSLPRWTAWLALLGADAHVLITASF